MCGARRGEVAWAARGPRCRGLRFYDTSFLCAACEAGLATGVVLGEVADAPDGGLPAVGAARTNPDLVRLVGRFKYHGIRGLAWPLTRLLAPALAEGSQVHGTVEALVPVPLHRRRRRTRGFNQAEVLSRGLAEMAGLPVLDGILMRSRSTQQQAKLRGTEGRRCNLAGAFRARAFRVRAAGVGGSGETGRVRRVCLVDDLVTSGWTVRAATEALQKAGWKVAWVLALGLAAELKKPGRQVDTRESGF